MPVCAYGTFVNPVPKLNRLSGVLCIDLAVVGFLSGTHLHTLGKIAHSLALFLAPSPQFRDRVHFAKVSVLIHGVASVGIENPY